MTDAEVLEAARAAGLRAPRVIPKLKRDQKRVRQLFFGLDKDRRCVPLPEGGDLGALIEGLGREQDPQ
jgi:hypothetical protein